MSLQYSWEKKLGGEGKMKNYLIFPPSLPSPLPLFLLHAHFSSPLHPSLPSPKFSRFVKNFSRSFLREIFSFSSPSLSFPLLKKFLRVYQNRFFLSPPTSMSENKRRKVEENPAAAASGEQSAIQDRASDSGGSQQQPAQEPLPDQQPEKGRAATTRTKMSKVRDALIFVVLAISYVFVVPIFMRSVEFVFKSAFFMQTMMATDAAMGGPRLIPCVFSYAQSVVNDVYSLNMTMLSQDEACVAAGHRVVGSVLDLLPSAMVASVGIGAFGFIAIQTAYHIYVVIAKRD